MNLQCVQTRLDLIRDGNLHADSESAESTQLKLELKNHQKTMIAAMHSLESGRVTTKTGSHTVHTNIGICADSTGAGKSIEMLAHIAEHPVYIPKESIVEHYGSFAYFKSLDVPECVQSNLLVVPHSCVTQWQGYIEKFTSLPLSVVSKRRDIDRFSVESVRGQGGITLCSSSMYNEFIGNHNCIWTRVIYDEADTIAIPAARTSQSNFTWFITSSLQNLFFPSGSYLVQYPLPNSSRYMISRKYLDGIRRNGYIKDTFRILEHDNANPLLECIVLKNDDTFIQQSFSLPTPEIRKILCKAPAYIRVLEGNVSDAVLSMLNAGNVQGAIEKAGCCIDTSENIVQSVTQLYAERLENLKREADYVSSLQYTRTQDIASRKNRLTNIETQAAAIRKKMESMRARINDHKGGTCAVCFDEFEKPTVVACCQNVFCFACITRCIGSSHSRCPMCRASLTANELSVIDECGKQKAAQDTELRSKDKTLLEIVTSKPKSEGKYLIFSSHEQSFNAIECALRESTLDYTKLMGSISRVNSILNRYRNGALDVLMLNASHYGTGLNLENTTDLIFYHKMPPDMERQVIGRAQRAGRTSSLTIHYLYHENEMKST